MRKFVVATLGLASIGSASASRAVPIENSCAASVRSIADVWDAVAFPMPAKPAQSRVIGRRGIESTGEQVNYMRNQIRLAINDCSANREDAATRRVAIVSSLLRIPGIDAGFRVASPKGGGTSAPAVTEGFRGSSVDPTAEVPNGSEVKP